MQQHNNQPMRIGQYKQSAVRVSPLARRRINGQSQPSSLRPLTQPLTIQEQKQEGGWRRRLLWDKPPLCEPRARQRCLHPYEGRRRRNMVKAIKAGSQGTKARRPWWRSQPQVATPRCGCSPQNNTTINPLGSSYIINNLPIWS